jgi:uncharacterized low-complexity protein
MSRFNARNTAGMLALALGGLVVSSTSFAAQPLAQGHVAKANHATAEGKCGEGKCGDDRRATIDADHDGRVSLAEAQAAAPGRAAELAKKDVDHDGFISARESYESIKALYEANGKAMPAGRFKAFDK